MSLPTKRPDVPSAGGDGQNDLPAACTDDDPTKLFAAWFEIAVKARIYLPESMTLATCDANGHPRARIVLLKRYDERGFIFFTNYSSHKAEELANNPYAALVLHWNVLERQIRIEGMVEKLSREESNHYFLTRPRGSRIGAWASRQSAQLSERQELLNQVQRREKEFAHTDVPLPPFWGGYLLNPLRMEFWQGRKSRLHERVVFSRKGQEPWQAQLLYP